MFIDRRRPVGKGWRPLPDRDELGVEGGIDVVEHYECLSSVPAVWVGTGCVRANHLVSQKQAMEERSKTMKNMFSRAMRAYKARRAILSLTIAAAALLLSSAVALAEVRVGTDLGDIGSSAMGCTGCSALLPRPRWWGRRLQETRPWRSRGRSPRT
jgi:hypothetical protein